MHYFHCLRSNFDIRIRQSFGLLFEIQEQKATGRRRRKPNVAITFFRNELFFLSCSFCFFLRRWGAFHALKVLKIKKEDRSIFRKNSSFYHLVFSIVLSLCLKHILFSLARKRPNSDLEAQCGGFPHLNVPSKRVAELCGVDDDENNRFSFFLPLEKKRSKSFDS